MQSGNRVPHIRTSALIATRISILVLTALVFLASAGCGGGSSIGNNSGSDPVPARVSGTIAVGTAPVAIVADSAHNKIYVMDFGTQPTGTQGCPQSGADVTAIDGAAQSTTSVGFWLSSSTPMTPVAAALNPANHTLYALAQAYWSGINGNGNCGPFLGRIESFDTSSFQQFSNRVIANFPSGIDVNPNTGSIYVTYPAASGAVDVWDSNWQLVATISVGSAPIGIAVNPTSNKIYVVNKASNDISVIDGATNSVVATITDPNALAPIAVAVNSVTNTIYVANSQSNNLTVIDGSSDSVAATLAVGTTPSGVGVDSQTNFIYVANAGKAQAGDAGNITVINGKTNATQSLADPNAKSPVAVAANPNTNKIYVVNTGSNNVTVISGARN